MTQKFEPPISTSNLYLPDFENLCGIFRESFDPTGQLMPERLLTILERRLAEYHDAKYCVTFATGFWALVAAVRLRSLPSPDEVIIPSLTYRRLADVVHWSGKTPRFVDVEPVQLAICPAEVERAISNATSLILAVHPIVGCCDVQALLAIAQTHRVPIIFDAVESVHESVGLHRVGSFGVGEVFSFHASKLINGLEGGYVCTDDPEFKNQLMAFRDPYQQHQPERSGVLRMNSRLNAGHAAFALAGLDELELNVRHNQKIYENYLRETEGLAGINVLRFDERESTSFKNVVAEVTEPFPIDRNALVQVLNSEGVLARAYYSPPLHHKTFGYPVQFGDLEVTDAAEKRLINLPCGQRVSVEDVRDVCRRLKQLAGRGLDGDSEKRQVASPEVARSHTSTSQLPPSNQRPDLREPNIPQLAIEDYENVFGQIYQNQYFTNHGPLAREFESLLEQHLSINHVVTVGNESLALLIALAGLEISGEIILPAFGSHLASELANWLGLNNVYCDVEHYSHQVSRATLATALTARTEAVVLIETWGNRCDQNVIDYLKQTGLKRIVVAFDSFDSQAQGRLVESDPDSVTVFSFGPEQRLSTLEGGAIVTQNDRLAEVFRNIRSSYGVRQPCSVKATCNGRFSEFQAGVGIRNLALIEPDRRHRLELFQTYEAILNDCPSVEIYGFGFTDQVNAQYFPILVEQAFPLTRDQLLLELNKIEFEDFQPAFRNENLLPQQLMTDTSVAQGSQRLSKNDFPRSRDLDSRIIFLPTGNRISPLLASKIARRIKSLA